MFLLLLSACLLAGIKADQLEDRPIQHVVLKGRSVHLHIPTSPGIKTKVSWMINNTLIVEDGVINPSYTNKVDFNPENFTLHLKKLNYRDNGVYKGMFTHMFSYTSITHEVKVAEAVPRPVMTFMHSNLSAGLCYTSVNCSVQNEWAWSTCSDDHCKTHQMSLNKFSITVSSSNGTIWCHGNNNISTNSASQSMAKICREHNRNKSSSAQVITVVACVVGVFLLLLILVIRVRWHSFSKRCDTHQNPRRPMEPASFSAVGGARSSSRPQVRTVCEEVGRPEQIPRIPQSSDAESIYSYLQLPDEAAPTVNNVIGFSTGNAQKAASTPGNCVTSVYTMVQDEVHSQLRAHVRGVPGETPRQNQPTDTLYSVIQPKRTLSETRHSASPEEIGEPHCLLGNVTADSHVVRHQDSGTLQEQKHLDQPGTLYSTVQKQGLVL